MRLLELTSEDLVIPELSALSRDELLREVVGCIVKARPHVDGASAYRLLLEREQIGSTAIGSGLAIPHAKLSLNQAVACLARSKQGVDFGALDGKPAFLFFTILAPTGNAGLHLKALARASRLFMDQDFRQRLLEAPDRHAIWEALRARDAELG